LGRKKDGICSLPALANGIPRQILLVKKIPHIIVIDGCHNECSKKILDRIGTKYERYINLENDFGYKNWDLLLLSDIQRRMQKEFRQMLFFSINR